MPKLVDMARSPAEIKDAAPLASPVMNEPLYDYGLHMCFNNETLEKLNLDDDVEVGDMLDARMMLKVTSVSKNDTGDGPKCRIEVVATHMGVEDESHEYDEEYDDGEEEEYGSGDGAS